MISENEILYRLTKLENKNKYLLRINLFLILLLFSGLLYSFQAEKIGKFDKVVTNEIEAHKIKLSNDREKGEYCSINSWGLEFNFDGIIREEYEGKITNIPTLKRVELSFNQLRLSDWKGHKFTQITPGYIYLENGSKKKWIEN